MAVKTCCNCEERYVKGVSGFDIFPREDHRWCSWKCLFLWLIKHDVRYGGQPILSIQCYRPRRTLAIEDCIKYEDTLDLEPDQLLNYLEK